MDAAIDYAREELDLEAPGADMLYSDPYRILTEDTQSMTYLGQAVIDGVRCHHIASRGRSVDWQLWVEKGARALPRKIVVTTRFAVGDPQYIAEMDWDLKPRIDKSTFVFDVPTGVTEIPFDNAAAIKGARISWYDDCVHSPFFEHAERFNRELDEFATAIQAQHVRAHRA